MRVPSRIKVSEIFNSDWLRGPGKARSMGRKTDRRKRLLLDFSRVRSMTERSFTIPWVHRRACKAVRPIRSQAISYSSGRGKEGQEQLPSPPHKVTADLELLLGLLGTIGCATALALARVFAFATVVTGLAAALALAGVLALASVLFFDLLVVLLVFPLVLALLLGAEGSFQRRKQSRSLNRYSGSGEQSRERRTCEHGFCRFRHFHILPSN